jgi:hypothetical protein
MPSSGLLRLVTLVRADVSEELSTSTIRVTGIGELGTTLAVTSNRRTLRRNTKWERKLVWNIRLRMQRGVGVAGSGVGFVNGQATKRDRKLCWKGWVGLFLNTLGMRNPVAKCTWVKSRKF